MDVRKGRFVPLKWQGATSGDVAVGPSPLATYEGFVVYFEHDLLVVAHPHWNLEYNLDDQTHSEWATPD